MTDPNAPPAIPFVPVRAPRTATGGAATRPTATASRHESHLTAGADSPAGTTPPTTRKNLRAGGVTREDPRRAAAGKRGRRARRAAAHAAPDGWDDLLSESVNHLQAGAADHVSDDSFRDSSHGSSDDSFDSDSFRDSTTRDSSFRDSSFRDSSFRDSSSRDSTTRDSFRDFVGRDRDRDLDLDLDLDRDRDRDDTFDVAADDSLRPPSDSTERTVDPDPLTEVSRWLDFGPLAPYLADEAVTDVFVNGASGLWVDNGERLTRQDSWQADERSLRELAVRLISLGGRHIDEATPCVDVRLRDGMRVHAVLPPISTSGTLLSIRVPRRARFRLDELAQAGTLSPSQVVRLRHLIASRSNLLVTGASGSGKTTLLSAILGEASPHERIVTIEDVAELRVEHPHVVALEARQPNLEGAGEIGMTRLLREALRMRPDRLVVGECRGAEIRELLGALNTGHDGGAGTLHANSLRDVPARIEALGALAGMSQEAVARQTVSAIGQVLHLEREGGVRSLAQIGRFRLDERGHLAMEGEAIE